MNDCAGALPMSEAHLADAFTTFVAAADRLERSHWQLHDEVSQLRAELEERNRALASSQAENDRMRLALRQILDALPCGVIVLDTAAEKITLSNPEARRLLQLPSSEALDWHSLPEAIRIMLRSGNGESWKQGDEHDFSVSTADTSRCVTVRYSRNARSDSKYESNQVILTCRDTTAFKQTEREREASRNLLALAEMSTVLAHEVRNPLGSMELLTGLLAGDPGLSDDSKQCVAHLQAGVRGLSAVVNNVLRFHNTGTSNLQPTKLGDALRSAVNFAQPLARQSGVRLSSELNVADVEIAADTSELNQIVLNLVCNALRHTPAGGQIKISARVTSGSESPRATVEISDSGKGISPENLPHIFEAGFTTGTQSPGLGLAVCRRIVEQHRGTITVQSELGQGATFHMEFPVL